MPDYKVFGGVLRTDLHFPELPPSRDAPPTWVLNQVERLPTHAASEILGREQVEQGVEVTLAETPDGLRLRFDDTGAFDLSRDGRRITWVAPAAPDMEAVRKDVLGLVFALALELDGVRCLHGSAVAVGREAVAFLAPKFHGKSTTATALVNAGGRLLADDLVPVTPEVEPKVLPSIPVVQLWRDSAERVAGGAPSIAAEVAAPKLQVTWGAADRNANAPVLLAAVYLLAPVHPESAGGVRRERIGGVEAALALLGQAKVGALLGVARRSALLGELVEMANRVPVYRLEIPRDFDRIGELTSSLLGWHDPERVTESGIGPA